MPIFIDIQKYLFQKIESKITIGTEFMSKRPNNAIQDGHEILLLQGEKRGKIIFNQSFEEAEEIRTNLRKWIKIAGD